MARQRSKTKRLLVPSVVLAGLISCFTLVSFSDSPAAGVSSVSTVGLGGMSSQLNTVGFALGGRYALVAPYAPVNGDDNHFLYIVDTQNPGAPPIRKNLNFCFYPSNLIVTPQNGAFVRATCAGSPDGSVAPGEVINYYQLQTANNKVRLLGSSLLTFYIPPVPGRDPAFTPTSFGIGNQSKVLIYTNGASIFSASLDQGYNYQVDIVPLSSYQPQVDPNDPTADFDEITGLSVDQATDIVTVTVTGRLQGQNFSQLYFYRVNEGAGSAFDTLDLLKLVDKEQFPDGATMTWGSNAVVSPDSKFGYFALDDGSVCSVRLAGDITAPKITVLGQYASMVASDPANRGARLVEYDATSSSLAVVKKGTVLYVRRPAYGHGSPGVRRPAYVKEAPAAVVGRLGADGSFTGPSEFTDFGLGEQQISNLVFDLSGNGFLTTGSGSVLSVGQSGLEVLGTAVPRIGQLVSDSVGANLIGVSSYGVDADNNIVQPGSLVIMSLTQSSIASKRALLDHSVTAGTVNHIRRPCSVQRR